MSYTYQTNGKALAGDATQFKGKFRQIGVDDYVTGIDSTLTYEERVLKKRKAKIRGMSTHDKLKNAWSNRFHIHPTVKGRRGMVYRNPVWSEARNCPVWEMQNTKTGEVKKIFQCDVSTGRVRKMARGGICRDAINKDRRRRRALAHQNSRPVDHDGKRFDIESNDGILNHGEGA